MHPNAMIGRFEFDFDIEKNEKLKADRCVDFDEIISLIENGSVIDVLDHPNQKKYPNQKIYVIDISGYVWLVPYVRGDGKIFLKTAFPSRKYTKQYLEEKNGKEHK